MSEPRLLLFHGRGVISALIRWQTRGEYSHSAILLPDGETILEAWQGEGVRKKKITSWEGVDRFRINAKVDWDVAIAFAEKQIGKGYDYLQVLRFVSRRKGSYTSNYNSNWFCSEYCFETVLMGGCALLRTDESYRISPAHLALSPLIDLDP